MTSIGGELEFAPSESRETEAEDEEKRTQSVAKSVQDVTPFDESDKVENDTEEIDELELDEPVAISNEEDDLLAAWNNSTDDWNWD